MVRRADSGPGSSGCYRDEKLIVYHFVKRSCRFLTAPFIDNPLLISLKLTLDFAERWIKESHFQEWQGHTLNRLAAK